MKFYIRTFGCQMNTNDSEAIAGILISGSHELVEDPENSDIVIINTCAVRRKAEEKFYGKLGEIKKLKMKKPNLIVAVCGCVAEKERERIIEKYDFVNFVFGTRSITKILDLLERAKKGERFAYFGDHLDELDHTVPRFRLSSHHAWVTVIYGCNKFCSYCIVPYTRGREKSRRMDDVLKEVSDLVKKGYIEITYLGQNVDSYGKDLGDGTSLAKLLEETVKFEKLERIWFLTSYPSDFSDELIDVIAKNGKIARSIHLPVQSGSDRILKLMKRNYTVADYIQLLKKIRDKIEGVSISSDIIVGFPNETEDDFMETVKLVETAKFERLNLAIYSPREGTLAYRFYEDNVPRDIKVRRLQFLLNLQKRINRSLNERYVGKTVEIIGEGKLKKTGDLYGRTINNKIVIFKGVDEMIGRKVYVKINRVSAGPLYGEVVKWDVSRLGRSNLDSYDASIQEDKIQVQGFDPSLQTR